MAALSLQHLIKRFHTLKEDTIKDISLDIETGELVVFVGPSGCGKSTLLRMIAGLEEPTNGEIYLDQTNITDVRPSRRNIAMVFQSYALYPHMNVEENMAFALKLAKLAPAIIAERVKKTAAMLDLTAYLSTKPKHLSGGQRQRVAIGRAIVREPQLFLFDEPLSNLDATLRVQTRLEISLLHKRLKTTMVYVTHDQVEAMTLADRIVVLNDGTLEQVGTPDDIYHHPRNLFVAGFIGTPKMSFFQASVKAIQKNTLTLEIAGHQTIQFQPPLATATTPIAVGDPLTLGIRPEHIQLHSPAQPNSTNPTNLTSSSMPTLTASVNIIENLGSDSYLYGTLHTKTTESPQTTQAAQSVISQPLAPARLAPSSDLASALNAITVRLQGDVKPLKDTASVTIALDPEKIYLFDQSGQNIFSESQL